MSTDEALMDMLDQSILFMAKEYADKGVELYQAGDFKGALEEFMGAQELLPSTSNLYNIARCHHNLGNYDDAAAYYRKYIEAKGPKSEKAKKYLYELYEIKSTVTIESTPNGAEIFIDGADHPAGLTPRTLKIKPGPHIIGVGIIGYKPEYKEVEVPIGGKLLVAFYLKMIPPNEVTEQPAFQPVVPMPPKAIVPAPPEPHAESDWPKPPVTLQHDAKNSVTNLLTLSGGITSPMKFEQVGMFGHLGVRWDLGLRSGAHVGLGIDGLLSSQGRLWLLYLHAGFQKTLKKTLHLYGLLGVGATVLVSPRKGLQIDRGIHRDMLLRPELGLGWNIKGFNLRIALLSFAMNLALGDIEKRPTGFYMPSLTLGYEF